MRLLLAENRRTLALAVPIMAGHIGQMLMGLIDTVMVARLGVVPLGACAFANTLLSIPLVFGFGVLSAVSVRAAHAHGSGNRGDARPVVRGGFLLALVLGLLVGLLAHVTLPFIAVFGQPEAVNASVGGYFIICAWSAIPVFFTTVSKNYCEAFVRPWPPFWIMIAGVALNALLNWLLIFGNLGFPAMGLEGAAIATLIARVLTAVGVWGYPAFSKSLRDGWPVGHLLADSFRPAKALVQIGLPVGTMHFFEVSGFAIGSLMMGWIGLVPLAAHQIAITCAATTFMVPLGLSQALCVRVGHARGAGRIESARPIVFGGIGLAVAIMSVFALVFVFGGRAIASVFVADPAVIALSAQLLLLAAVFQVFDGIQIVSSGALRGLEDTRVPMLLCILSYWVVVFPVSYIAAFFMGWGAWGVWLGFVVGLGFAAAVLFARVLKKFAAVSPNPRLVH